MNNQHMHDTTIQVEIVLVVPFLLALTGYYIAVVYANRRFNKWPISRTLLFTSGILCASIASIGPLANAAHESFAAHMLVHLLLGMLSPLLIVLGSPISLLLRSLPTNISRKVSYLLRLRLFQIIHHPIVTSLLNIGGLWLLYTTNLFSLMHENKLLYLIIHIHVFVAGYLFTASFLYNDPVKKRFSHFYRSIVLIFALGAHAILAKYIYAFPPIGVPKLEAEVGGMLMYYGGDAVDIVLIILLCKEWYRATRPRIKPSLQHATS
ncbi:cytochrome c oxidase assembly protein [Ornithinibacillus scapharcae]|uniref:cytochrome c oxidase assembly protein n=1 Tax=Ornithinibacillus scapharcae TaxID=1147159 RepID=UPI000225AAB7|nr:cytochrome c oxidase assembly protein [Ornithinibacillus scapharcae]